MIVLLNLNKENSVLDQGIRAESSRIYVETMAYLCSPSTVEKRDGGLSQTEFTQVTSLAPESARLSARPEA